MQTYDFDHITDRYTSECVKWHYFEKDVLPMWVADMDFQAPPAVIQALKTRVVHGIFGYAKPIEGLAEAIQAWLGQHHGWRVDVDDIVLLPGVIVGLNKAAQTLAEPGKGILIQPPVYPPFFEVSKNAGLPGFESPLLRTETGRYEVDWDDFEDRISKGCNQFLLCNPHNPVGRVFEKSELEKMAEICLKHGVHIISDEIHCDLVFEGHWHVPLSSLDPEIASRTITLMAPSKTFNIPGLDCAFAVIPNVDLRKRFKQAGRGLVGGVNILGMVAAKAAYESGGEWLLALLGYLQANRDLVYDFVRESLPGVHMYLPEGTYLAWLDCRQAGLNVEPCQFFIDQARVGLNDGRVYGAGGEGFVRLNFGCPRPILIEGLNRMAAALEQHRGK